MFIPMFLCKTTAINAHYTLVAYSTAYKTALGENIGHIFLRNEYQLKTFNANKPENREI